MIDRLVYALWYGRLRRGFRAIVTRLMRRGPRVALGPLKGSVVENGAWPYTLGIFELHVQTALVEGLKGGDVFYDVGANNGFLTLLAARRVGPKGHVYAFEPLPENAAGLVDLMAANGVRNYTLVTAAVSESSGRMTLFGPGSDKTPSLVQGARGDAGIVVEGVALDDFVRSHQPPTLVKVDVEGAESMVLNGARELLAATPTADWIVELHDRANDAAVTHTMRSQGYAVRDLIAPLAASKRYPRHIVASRQQVRDGIG